MSVQLGRKFHSGGIVVAGSLLVLLSACSQEEDLTTSQTVRPVKTAVVSVAANMTRRSYPAVILPAQQAELAFKVPGQVIELPIRAANRVSEGDMIAQLDRREFEAAVSRLESQLDQATAQLSALKSGARSEDLAALQAKVKAAKAQLETQRAQLGRITRLAEKGTIARAELDKERAKLSVEEANYNVAQQELKKAQVGAREEEFIAQEAVIRDIETQLAEAKADLEDTTLRAPFDGIVASRQIENFANVQANSVVAVLQQLETIDLQFDVPGRDVAALGKQKNAVTKARLDAAPGKEYAATLAEFGTQADAATQTFRGRVSIPYPQDIVVLPGMTGTVIVEAGAGGNDKLSVPESALAAGPDGASFVWIVDPLDNAVSKRVVTPTNLSGGSVTISGNVAAGDRVVTAGVSFLREGMTVKPMSEDTE